MGMGVKQDFMCEYLGILQKSIIKIHEEILVYHVYAYRITIFFFFLFIYKYNISRTRTTHLMTHEV